MSAARHVDARHLLVEEDQRAERLVLRRRGVVALNGEVIEKGQNLGHTELAWVALPVEDHEDADPLGACFRNVRSEALEARAACERARNDRPSPTFRRATKGVRTPVYMAQDAEDPKPQ